MSALGHDGGEPLNGGYVADPSYGFVKKSSGLETPNYSMC